MRPHARATHARELLLLSVVLTTGCYADSDAFARRAAKLICVHVRECDGPTFEVLFGDMATCRDKRERELDEAFAELPPECEYQPDEGRDCIHEMYEHRKDCSDQAGDEIAAACGFVFECS